MQNIGTDQDCRCHSRLLRLFTVKRSRGLCARFAHRAVSDLSAFDWLNAMLEVRLSTSLVSERLSSHMISVAR